MKKIIKSQKSKLPIPIIFILILASLAFLSYGMKNRPITPIHINEVTSSTGLVDVSLSPSTVSLVAGSTTTIKMMVHAGTNFVNGVSADISYNPSELEIISVTQGSHFPLSLDDASWSSNKITFTYNLPINHDGKQGDGEVASIVVKYKQGSPKLSFTTATLATVKGVAGNSLKNARDVQFSAAIASASPQASPPQSPSITTRAIISGDSTCNRAILKWDKIDGAKGYYIDISKNSQFSTITTSGKLRPEISEFIFSNLQRDTTYYARITQAEIHDFPKYGPITEFKTALNCITASPSIPPRLSPSPRAQPLRSPTPIRSTPPSATPLSTPTPSTSTTTPTSMPTQPSSYDPSISDLTDLNQFMETNKGVITETPGNPSFLTKLFTSIGNFFEDILRLIGK